MSKELGSMGSMHPYHLCLLYPAFTRLHAACTHSHTYLLSQRPGMPQTKQQTLSVSKEEAGASAPWVLFQLCPCKVRKVLSNLRHTVSVMPPCQGCPWESQQKGPSWPHLQHAVMFMAWSETFLVQAKCQVCFCVLASFLKDNFSDQTSDLEKPSL